MLLWSLQSLSQYIQHIQVLKDCYPGDINNSYKSVRRRQTTLEKAVDHEEAIWITNSHIERYLALLDFWEIQVRTRRYHFSSIRLEK
jgi:hypothetical protein